MACSQCGFICQVQLYGGLRCHTPKLNAVTLRYLAFYTGINMYFTNAIIFCPLWSSDNFPGRV